MCDFCCSTYHSHSETLRRIERNVSRMAVTQQNLLDAVNGESGDIANLVSGFHSLLTAIDAFIAAGVDSPDAAILLDKIATNRAALGSLISEETADLAKFTVAPSISFSPTSLSLSVGGAVGVISASASDGLPLSFTSNDDSIATVSTGGTVTPVAPGSTSIVVSSATAGSATVVVTVA